ncbi:hypothetical protein E2P81_ATG11482 [Venturia nashicola]|nr:hypothetical protein E2P81_ATG11482 [Venturia nashicola]
MIEGENRLDRPMMQGEDVLIRVMVRTFGSKKLAFGIWHLAVASFEDYRIKFCSFAWQASDQADLLELAAGYLPAYEISPAYESPRPTSLPGLRVSPAYESPRPTSLPGLRVSPPPTSISPAYEYLPRLRVSPPPTSISPAMQIKLNTCTPSL